MRVYLPYTLPALARLLAEAQTAAPPLRGFAVTPALREWYSSGDEEELEYVAMTHAARASLRLLHGDPGAPGRRVVLAAEVPQEHVAGVAGFDEPALVEIGVPRPTCARRSPRCPPRTAATRTPGSPWTGPRDTSCSGMPPRSWRT